MQRSRLNIEETREIFFEDTALVGIVCPTPAHRFCWLVNKYFDLEFERETDGLITQIRKTVAYHYPYFVCQPGGSHSKYRLYSLKNGKEPLLTDYKEFDFIWMVQATSFEEDVAKIAVKLKEIPEVVLTHILFPHELKNVNSLLV